MDFVGFLLCIFALNVAFQQVPHTPDNFTVVDPEYVSAENEVDCGDNYIDEPNGSFSVDTATMPAEMEDFAHQYNELGVNNDQEEMDDTVTLPTAMEDIPQHYEQYDELDVTNDQEEMDHTDTLPAAMEDISQHYDDFNVKTKLAKQNANDNIQTEPNTNLNTDTSVLNEGNGLLATALTVFKLAIFLILLAAAAFCIASVLIIWINRSTLFPTNNGVDCKIQYRMSQSLIDEFRDILDV